MSPFGKVLLVNVLVAVIIGMASFMAVQIFPRGGDLGVWVMLVAMGLFVLQGIGCWIASLVFLLTGKSSHGLGFLLSGFVVFLLGFGTCSAMLVVA